MSYKVTLESISDIESYPRDDDKRDLGNDIFIYFGDVFQKRHWGQIGDEGLKLYNIWGHEAEDESPIYYLFNAIAASAANKAFLAVADAIGVNKRDIINAVSDFYEDEESHPETKPIGIEEFIKRVSHD